MQTPELSKQELRQLIDQAIANGQEIKVYAPGPDKPKRRPYKAPPKPVTFTPI